MLKLRQSAGSCSFLLCAWPMCALQPASAPKSQISAGSRFFAATAFKNVRIQLCEKMQVLTTKK